MEEQEIYNQFKEGLLNSGSKITDPRKAIIGVFAGMEKPLTPMEVFERSKAVYPRIGLMTVYRTIEILISIGLLDRIHNVHGCEAVFLSPSKHQHLLLCSSCGTAVYFDGLDVQDEFKRIEGKFNFNITDHWMQVFGTCSECKL